MTKKKPIEKNLIITICLGEVNQSVEPTVRTEFLIDDETAFPTLYVAVVFGLGEVVEACIQNGTNVNFNDKNGWIPLHTAAAFGMLFGDSFNLVNTPMSNCYFFLKAKKRLPTSSFKREQT